MIFKIIPNYVILYKPLGQYSEIEILKPSRTCHVSHAMRTEAKEVFVKHSLNE